MEKPIHTFIWIATSICLLSVLVGFIILLTKTYINRIRKEIQEKNFLVISHQKTLINSSIQILERERERISSDLHDDLIGQLYRIKLMNEDGKLNKLLAESISTARNISHDLTPPLIEESSLIELITDFIAPYKKKYIVTLTCFMSLKLDLTKQQKLHIFRIFQELINNIIKHSQANSINITLRGSEKYFALLLQDNGKGITITTNVGGLGMKNIELRVQVLKGSYRLKPNKPTGTTFMLLLKNNQSNSNE
ncbi:sensor histidine kinase [Bernardetia sp. OM2101]|uniref:sensor histidine kinase n=1 Tax=Bernardetia sp. OM2101 TaxID=3344876 RepID=UPI0035D115D9